MPLIDHSLQVRRAVVEHLKTDVRIAALVGNRIFDDPTSEPAWPFIRYGVPITGGYEATRLSGSTHRVTLHGFDKGPGTQGAMEIAAAIVNSVEDITFGELSTIDLRWLETRILNDPSTRGAYHAVVEYEIVTAEYA